MSQPEMDIRVRSGMTRLNFDLLPMDQFYHHSSLLSPVHSATSSIQSFKQQTKTGKSKGTHDL